MSYNNLHDAGATPANTLDQLLHLGTGTVSNGVIRTGSGAQTPLSFVNGELAVEGQIHALGVPVFLVLAADVSTSLTAGVAIDDFDFVPVAGATYLIEMFLVARSATTASGVQLTASGGSGTLVLVDPASQFRIDSPTGTYAATDAPVANASFGIQLAGVFAPTATTALEFALKPQDAGTTATLKAGSVMKITRMS